MLSIGKLGSDPDPAAYDLEVVASGVEDYYLSASEVPGRWLGPAASSLGLAGTVEPEPDDRWTNAGRPVERRPTGRALDEVAGRIHEVASAAALAAGAFGIDAARLHWDFTSVAFCDAYEDQDPARPAQMPRHCARRSCAPPSPNARRLAPRSSVVRAGMASPGGEDG